MARLKDRLLLAPRLKRRKVEGLSDWLSEGEEIWARELTAAERMELMEESGGDAEGPARVAAQTRLMARAVAVAACDAEGNSLFEAKDAAALERQSLLFLGAVFEAVAELSGLTERAQEDARKNSAAPTANGSHAG